MERGIKEEYGGEGKQRYGGGQWEWFSLGCSAWRSIAYHSHLICPSLQPTPFSLPFFLHLAPVQKGIEKKEDRKRYKETE